MNLYGYVLVVHLSLKNNMKNMQLLNVIEYDYDFFIGVFVGILVTAVTAYLGIKKGIDELNKK